MQERVQQYIKQAKSGNVLRRGSQQIVAASALLVVLAVFWWLKLTGITIAGEAFCGKAEHTHSESCQPGCELEEHTHEALCYSNINADLETADVWELTLKDVNRTGSTAEDLVDIALSQLGFEESELNFQVDADGTRRGITRYGQWYGNPYGDWSAMFASFCLHYAGVEDVPMNSGPQAMQLEWEEAGLYRSKDSGIPRRGDLIFLAKDGGSINAVAIITGFSGDTITVVEGDLDNKVAETTYSISGPEVQGYGLVPDSSQPIIMMAATLGTEITVAQKVDYSSSLLTEARCFLLYTEKDGQYYAIDGSGDAVPVSVDDSGSIYADVSDPAQLLWSFTASANQYTIQNLGTGRYLYAANNSVTSAGANNSRVESQSGGIRIRSGNAYVTLDSDASSFSVTQDEEQAAIYQLGAVDKSIVWLDGTAGGQGQLGGSPDLSYTVVEGATFKLPETWQTPEKYEQTLRGWYDVTNQRYYAPGAEVEVTGNMVFYADWVASTYDFGQFNSQTSNTTSTNSFITAHVFDYNYLFNVMSANPSITVNANSHTETWSMIENGKVQYGDMDSLEFVFIDYDGSSRLPDMSNRNDANNYLGEGIVVTGIYNENLANILFGTDNDLDPETGVGVIGKTYLGTGDYLFQLMTDPSDEYYGYYYYDSHRNAASYNQSEGRFYVYDYLEATSDSLSAGDISDFLPFNSPYVNNNGKTVRTYSHNGLNGEYAGVSHYHYDAKYNSGNDSTANAHTNYAFGLRLDVRFYLPNQPGALDANGETGNKDVYGNDMHFRFNGDDDVWVLVDGMLVLDIGGVHGVEGGDINFATGVVTLNGEVDQELSDALKTVTEGEHTLTIMYLERGSSQSNCAFYFNLAPRFSLDIQKEDVLTQELLDGAQFTVYTDANCTVPAQLYTSEEAYLDGQNSRSTFTVEDGVARLWGIAAGNTYYIKETKAPDAAGYGTANGVIRLTVDKDGNATYYVDVLPEPDGTPVSNGFTVHNIRIDEETRSMYLTVTNAPETVTEVTTVQVYKQWEDTRDHSDDYITAYLTVTDPNGTVRRIREITLSHENGWLYTWTNLPKYDYDNLTEVQYGILESYESGYYSTVRKVTQIVVTNSVWAEALGFTDGQTYILKGSSGYLSTLGSGTDTGYKWVDEDTAKLSPYALWTAHISGNTVKLTNDAGQTLTFNYGNGRPTNFYVSTGGETNNAKQYFRWVTAGNGLRLYYDAPNNRDYYLGVNLNSSFRFSYTTTAGNGLVLTPMTKITTTDIVDATDWAYQITNTPLSKENETSLTVTKQWDLGMLGKVEDYERAQVTIRLLANGVDTGRTVTLSLKNGWTDSFKGLPYLDTEGNIIEYTVLESWQTDEWMVSYGPIQIVAGEPNTYTTTVTNTHVSTGGPELPSTGTAAHMMYILCGSGIIFVTLIYGLLSKYRRERGRA